MTKITMSMEIEVLEAKQILANNAKSRSLQVLARSVLFDSDGDVITLSRISKHASVISMEEVKELVGHNLGYFHGLGFLHPNHNDNGGSCVASVAKSFIPCEIKLDALVLSELIASINRVLRAVSKKLLSVLDAGKYIARLVYALKQYHSTIDLPSTST